MRHGFTLIELLVVITIIVVLLALLTPAMDKAIYQAELAVCGTKLKAIANGVMFYAGDNGRKYPTRRAGNLPIIALNGAWDDRRLIQPYFSINKTLQCPLGGVVDLESKARWGGPLDGGPIGTGETPHGVEVFAAYNMWYGFRYRIAGEQGMRKIGDRWTYTNALDFPEPRQIRLNLLAADRDRHVGNEIRATHPDAEAILSLYEIQGGGMPSDPASVRPSIASFWGVSARLDRGTMEMNFARDDNSVQRLDAVYWNEWAENARVARVPSIGNDRDTAPSFPGFYEHVPAR